MFSESEQKATLQKIVESDEFKDAATYRDLLLFLYQATKNGESPKEITIAKEIFGKKDFDGERDAKIRVYIYNLRKKLDSYYLHEGRNERIRITIPKGNYLLQFDQNQPNRINPILKRIIYANLVFLTLIALINVYLWTSHTASEGRKVKPFYASVIWKEVLNSELPTLIVMGDYFLYQDIASDYRYFIRNPRVNSEQEFKDFLAKNPGQANFFRTTNLSFLGKFTVWCFNDIIQPLVQANVEVDLRLSSNLQWQDFQKYNIIFIGSFKTFGILKNYLDNLHFSYQVYPNTLYYHEPESDSTYAYHGPRKEESGFVKDYAIVTKLPGPYKNTIITFSSTHDIGHMSVVEAFTDPDFIKQFEIDYLSSKGDVKYFESVFEVQGFERTGFFPKLLHFRKIDADYTHRLPQN